MEDEGSMIRKYGVSSLIYLALLACAGPTLPASAATIDAPAFEGGAPVILSAGDLADLCASKPDNNEGLARRNLCFGFTLGVMAVAERQQASGGVRMFCTPAPAPDMAETMDAFVQLTKALPPSRSLPVIDGLLQFLQQRFPCKG
jgi:hypothetical protein